LIGIGGSDRGSCDILIAPQAGSKGTASTALSPSVVMFEAGWPRRPAAGVDPERRYIVCGRPGPGPGIASGGWDRTGVPEFHLQKLLYAGDGWNIHLYQMVTLHHPI
jgi:hypothetical protein